MTITQPWPKRLWLVRHGQSQGNVARDAAHEAGLDVIDLDLRDIDVPLSELGHQQARATGRWFAALPEDERPEIHLASPYTRARQTAEAICKAGGLAGGAKPTILDECLRDVECLAPRRSGTGAGEEGRPARLPRTRDRRRNSRAAAAPMNREATRSNNSQARRPPV